METQHSILTIAIIALFINLMVGGATTIYNNLPTDIRDQQTSANNIISGVDTSTRTLYDEHEQCEGDIENCVTDANEPGNEDTLSLTREDSLMNVGGYWTKITRFLKMTIFVQATLADQIHFENELLDWIIFLLLWAWQIAVLITIITAIFTRFK